MNVPTLLRRLLEASGWSQEGLAHRIGTSQATVSRWLDGSQEPRGKNWEAIRALAIEYGVLDAGQATMPPPSSAQPSAAQGEVRVDVLAMAIERLEAWLEEHRITLTPQRKAEAIALIYEIATDESAVAEEVRERRIGRVLRLVA